MNYMKKARRADKTANEKMDYLARRKTIEMEKSKATERSFKCFMVMMVAFLHDRLGFGKKRILDFFEYVSDQFEFVEQYSDYFEDMNRNLAEEIGIDVLKMELKNGKKDE